jgi:DNA polymerase/3'-5' exonuclease PolX
MAQLREWIARIHGLDSVWAARLATELRRGHIAPTSYRQTRTALRREPYYSTLPPGTRADLDYNFASRVPRKIIERLDAHLRNTNATIAGSYRREAATSSDIDLVWRGTRATWHRTVAELNRSQENSITRDKIVITAPYQGGEAKEECVVCFTIIQGSGDAARTLHYNVKMDVFWATRAQYPYMLLYATGNYNLNIRMRFIAKRQSMLLNQYGLYRLAADGTRGDPLHVSSERGIFNLLHMSYLEPRQRTI